MTGTTQNTKSLRLTHTLARRSLLAQGVHTSMDSFGHSSLAYILPISSEGLAAERTAKGTQRHELNINILGVLPEHQTTLGSGLRFTTRLPMCTAFPRPALSTARGLPSGSGTLREQVNINCTPHRAYLSELHIHPNFSTQFRASSPSVKFSIPPST